MVLFPGLLLVWSRLRRVFGVLLLMMKMLWEFLRGACLEFILLFSLGYWRIGRGGCIPVDVFSLAAAEFDDSAMVED